MAFVEFRSTRQKKESAYLSQFAANVTSADGEDGIIAKIFSIMDARNRFCVEFGALDGKLASNTWSLLNQHGWSGVQIEADPEKFRDLRKTYAGNPRVLLMDRFVDFTGDTLDVILRETETPVDLDLLSIDIDGADYYIWESLKAYRPRLVIIEYNPSIPNDVVFIQRKDLSVNQGTSLAALVDLARSKGYELIATTAGNAFFVVVEEFARFGIADNTIDAIRPADAAHESRFFQLYDGTLVLIGCRTLIWHELPIPHEHLQVLPPERRRFPGAIRH